MCYYMVILPSGVDYASGALPLQEGELQVHWERHNCEESELELTAPATTTGEIVIPFINDTTVLTLDEHVIWQEGTPLVDSVAERTDGIHISLQGGSYSLYVRQTCPPLIPETTLRGD